MKVFWSWQNDYAPNVCRHFIREALSDAVRQVGNELGLEAVNRPEIDHATKDVAGMADISNAILSKISLSAVFVADVTPIGMAEKKALPNPNVMLELGWAMKQPGTERIITILNTASGYGPDDLPFDIRHRRTMTFHLSPDAKLNVRAEVKKKLVGALVNALKTNLSTHLEQQAASQSIEGVAAKTEDRSIWATATDHLKYTDRHSQSGKRLIAFPNCARGYIRIIPAGWINEPPPVSEIEKLPGDSALWPRAEGTNEGDYGPCSEGFARFWITAKSDKDYVETRNVAMYFDQTGEFWVLHGTAVVKGKHGPTLCAPSLLKGWQNAIKLALSVFGRFEAVRPIKIEVGLQGISEARWPGTFLFEAPVSRKSELQLSRTLWKWTDEEQLSFLTDSYNKILDLFSIEHVDTEKTKQLLAQSN